jgi:hypothetical protein
MTLKSINKYKTVVVVTESEIGTHQNALFQQNPPKRNNPTLRPWERHHDGAF